MHLFIAIIVLGENSEGGDEQAIGGGEADGESSPTSLDARRKVTERKSTGSGRPPLLLRQQITVEGQLTHPVDDLVLTVEYEKDRITVIKPIRSLALQSPYEFIPRKANASQSKQLV